LNRWILDEALKPIEGKDIEGFFGFLDPFAGSYPGFLISGDHVHLVDDKCDCGLIGPALLEIKTSPKQGGEGMWRSDGSIRA